MNVLPDFDNATKLLHVGYSVLGMLVSMVILVKFKPTILPRMIVAVILGMVLVFCLTTPMVGDMERVKNIYSVGWLSLGLLFGIGRGEFVVEWLVRKFFGAPDQVAAGSAAIETEASEEKPAIVEESPKESDAL